MTATTDLPSLPATDTITVRDLFAAAALVGLLATVADRQSDGMTDSDASILETARTCGWESPSNLHGEDGAPLTLAETIASEAFSLADAMMKERRPAPGE
ncbi:MAG: hypothetical protein HQ582_31725 [Planctomycetes bacterium]|nr:hypothetical protein [Planctomycetota bacterium]